MDFLVRFKEDMEKAMVNVRKDIDEKLETKLVDIEKSIEKNADEARRNDVKQSEVSKVLEKRLEKMETDHSAAVIMAPAISSSKSQHLTATTK